MALQVRVTVDDITKRAKGGSLTLRLKVFAGGVDPEIAEPIFEDTALADIKARADEQTTQQLVNRATKKAGDALLEAATTYLRVEEYKTMVNTDAVEAAIVEALTPTVEPLGG